uniref:CSON002193 protein n=1 Tax=Culicoides sonorensis TaxID=179676 RepID=A0A336MJW0_CULSO
MIDQLLQFFTLFLYEIGCLHGPCVHEKIIHKNNNECNDMRNLESRSKQNIKFFEHHPLFKFHTQTSLILIELKLVTRILKGIRKK